MLPAASNYIILFRYPALGDDIGVSAFGHLKKKKRHPIVGNHYHTYSPIRRRICVHVFFFLFFSCLMWWWPTDMCVLFLVVKNTNTTPVCSPSELTRGVLIVLCEKTQKALAVALAWWCVVLRAYRSFWIDCRQHPQQQREACLRACEKVHLVCVCVALLSFELVADTPPR